MAKVLRTIGIVVLFLLMFVLVATVGFNYWPPLPESYDSCNSNSFDNGSYSYRSYSYLINGTICIYKLFIGAYAPDARTYRAAIRNKNFQLCENINIAKLRDSCYYFVAADKLKTNDHSVCDPVNAVRGRDICFYSFAIRNSSHLLCDRMSDNDVATDSGLEEYTKAYTKAQCHDKVYLNIASETGDISICDEKIKRPSTKDECYYDLALSTKNVSLCDNVTRFYINMREYCIRQLVAKDRTD